MTPFQVAFNRWWLDLPLESKDLLFSVLAAESDDRRNRRITSWDKVQELRHHYFLQPVVASAFAALLENVSRQRQSAHRTHRPITFTTRADATLPGSTTHGKLLALIETSRQLN